VTSPPVPSPRSEEESVDKFISRGACEVGDKNMKCGNVQIVKRPVGIYYINNMVDNIAWKNILQHRSPAFARRGGKRAR
jgi:hypothetical protein